MYSRTREALRMTLAVFMAGMLGVAAAAAYWQVMQADRLSRHALNPRTRLGLADTKRGGIYAADGEVLAWSERRGGRFVRRYRISPGLAHVIGYADQRLGLSGLELAYNDELSGRSTGGFSSLWASVTGTPPRGADVHTTIVPRVQVAAERALGRRRGAAVALDVATGAVLASTSFPGYEPERITERWATLSQDPESPLLNRVTQGLYPPGSSFKVLIALAAIERGLASRDSRFFCPGARRVGKDVIRDYQGRAHGWLDLTRATAVSCNYVFSGLGLELGPEGFERAVAKAGLFVQAPFDLGVSANRIPRAASLTDTDLAELGIGQGRLAVTPLAMAQLIALVARKGRPIEARLVESVERRGEAKARQLRPLTRPVAFPQEVIADVAGMLREAVVSGTGQAGEVPGLKVVGKTGSAENPHGRPHAWFIAYAPVDTPRVAVAVVLENAGTGGAVAAPVAAEIIRAALSTRP